MDTLIPLAILFAIVLLWLDGARAREIATATCKEACRRQGVQFLEGTVFLKQFAPHWGHHGLKMKRTFQFDYSIDGSTRHAGKILLNGMQLEAVYIESPGSTTLEGQSTHEDGST